MDYVVKCVPCGRLYTPEQYARLDPPERVRLGGSACEARPCEACAALNAVPITSEEPAERVAYSERQI